jgi:hypothetical protein
MKVHYCLSSIESNPKILGLYNRTRIREQKRGKKIQYSRGAKTSNPKFLTSPTTISVTRKPSPQNQHSNHYTNIILNTIPNLKQSVTIPQQ